MKKIIMYFLVSSSLFANHVVNAMVPVVDMGEILQTIELLKQAQQQYAALQTLKNQNDKQYSFLSNNLNGTHGYGNLFNNKNDLRKRQWSNEKWVDVLSASSNGNTGAFAQAQRNYKTLYPVVDAKQIAPSRSRDNLARTHYQQSSEISRAALAASSFSYDQINQHIQNLHEMLAKLEDNPTEKAAIDLNTRLVAELGFIQIEMLRQQSIQNQLIATGTQGEVNGLSEQSQFTKS